MLILESLSEWVWSLFNKPSVRFVSGWLHGFQHRQLSRSVLQAFSNFCEYNIIIILLFCEYNIIIILLFCEYNIIIILLFINTKYALNSSMSTRLSSL